MIPFSKYSGAGNDFVVVDADEGVDRPGRLARALCPRSTGVGVDGLALVRSRGRADVQVRFFNPDGSEFAVCGNGSRCVARWAADAGLGLDGRVTLVTDAGEVEASVEGDGVTLLYALPARVEGRRAVPFAGDRREGWLVRVGTPHFVLLLDDLPEGPIEELCRPVRYHDALGPEGANVNLVAPAGEGRVRIRTYERGVEGETRACGAGAMSAALALHAAGKCGRELSLETRGGEVLRVGMEGGTAREAAGEEGGGGTRRIRLGGPARFVFSGRYPWPREAGADRGAGHGPGGRHAAEVRDERSAGSASG